jgi:hypothetical protein
MAWISATFCTISRLEEKVSFQFHVEGVKGGRYGRKLNSVTKYADGQTNTCIPLLVSFIHFLHPVSRWRNAADFAPMLPGPYRDSGTRRIDRTAGRHPSLEHPPVHSTQQGEVALPVPTA